MSIVNLKESLKNIDIKTDMQYNLTALYESCNLSEEDKNDLVKYIATKEPPFMIGQFLESKAEVPAKVVGDDEVSVEDFEKVIDINDGEDHTMWHQFRKAADIEELDEAGLLGNYVNDLVSDNIELGSKVVGALGGALGIHEDWDDESDKYKLVAHKSVKDSDGFTTDYSMYYDPETEKYFFMFGDSELYTPDPDYADWEEENEEAAWEWFNSYNGFDEDENLELDEGMFQDAARNLADAVGATSQVQTLKKGADKVRNSKLVKGIVNTYKHGDVVDAIEKMIKNASNVTELKRDVTKAIKDKKEEGILTDKDVDRLTSIQKDAIRKFNTKKEKSSKAKGRLYEETEGDSTIPDNEKNIPFVYVKID